MDRAVIELRKYEGSSVPGLVKDSISCRTAIIVV
jgi:hypothetical protein